MLAATVTHTDNTITQNSFKSNKNIINLFDHRTLASIPLDTQLDILPSSTDPDECEDLNSFHSADPVKDPEDIIRIVNHLISKGRYRDMLLFTIGINTGLRCSDILSLKFSDILNKDATIKEEWYIVEKKTAKTKGRKQNRIDLSALADLSDEEMFLKIKEQVAQSAKPAEKKASPKPRIIYVNDAVKKAIIMYLQENPSSSMDDYLFRSQSHREKYENNPLTRRSVQRILEKTINEELGLNLKAGTHLMRKTFGYQFITANEWNPRALLLLQQAFNHSSERITLRYIGLNQKEIKTTYTQLNLGVAEN